MSQYIQDTRSSAAERRSRSTARPATFEHSYRARPGIGTLVGENVAFSRKSRERGGEPAALAAEAPFENTLLWWKRRGLPSGRCPLRGFAARPHYNRCVCDETCGSRVDGELKADVGRRRRVASWDAPGLL